MRGERDGADDVVVLKRVEGFTSVRVPYFCGEISGAGGCEGGVGGEAGLPDCTLVAEEGTYPVDS